MLVCCCGVQELVKAHVQRNQDHWFMPWILPTLEKPTKLWKSTSLSFRPPSTEFSTEFFGSVSGLFWKLAPAVWTEGGSFLGNAPCPASCLPPLTFLLQRACPSSFSQAHTPSRDTVPRTPQHPFLHEAPLALPTLAQPGRQQASRPGLSLVLLRRGSLSTAHCLIFTMLVRNAWLWVSHFTVRFGQLQHICTMQPPQPHLARSPGHVLKIMSTLSCFRRALWSYLWWFLEWQHLIKCFLSKGLRALYQHYLTMYPAGLSYTHTCTPERCRSCFREEPLSAWTTNSSNNSWNQCWYRFCFLCLQSRPFVTSWCLSSQFLSSYYLNWKF